MKWALRIGFLGILVVTLLVGMLAVTWRPKQGTGGGGDLSEDRLVEAVKSGSAYDVEVLLDHGADPDSRDADGKPVLWWAVRQGNEETVAVLLDHGAEPSLAERGGDTPLSLARELVASDPSPRRKAILERLQAAS
ncbi:MAG: ankyrin repeat domain-containing protein [Actinobacteria bacterium ATB1]|nr:ankyrin repeat domain-containing protein [Actinobacteria bacterium ATB1]